MIGPAWGRPRRVRASPRLRWIRPASQRTTSAPGAARKPRSRITRTRWAPRGAAPPDGRQGRPSPARRRSPPPGPELADSHGRIRETRLLSRGSGDALYVDRATVLRTALDMAAVSFVLAHNHPSGDPTPTREDEAMALELRHLSSELHVPLTAHVICGLERSGWWRAWMLVVLVSLLAPL
ncbi:JAB domain-containing protein [Sorangium sp. So ce887]|uniref:JAB domain-containing protein n=1 Tax=Sorangium sp. So ce887 TaxID=3133324 RepID=UPI003F643542